MWILVEVDESSDVGVNEKRRFLMRRHIELRREVVHPIFSGEYYIEEYIAEVHPATKEVR